MTSEELDALMQRAFGQELYHRVVSLVVDGRIEPPMETLAAFITDATTREHGQAAAVMETARNRPAIELNEATRIVGMVLDRITVSAQQDGCVQIEFDGNHIDVFRRVAHVIVMALTREMRLLAKISGGYSAIRDCVACSGPVEDDDEARRICMKCELKMKETQLREQLNEERIRNVGVRERMASYEAELRTVRNEYNVLLFGREEPRTGRVGEPQ